MLAATMTLYDTSIYTAKSPAKIKQLVPDKLPAQVSETELVVMLATKDVNAYNLLYTRYSKAMYGILFRIVPCEHDAMDLLQDCFVKVWQNIDHYDASKGTLFTWLLNICRNKAIDHRRSKSFRNGEKNQGIDSVKTFEGTPFEINFNPDYIGLKNLSQQLGYDYHVLIDAVYFQGYTHQEVSEKLNVPLGTVKTRIRSALIKMRKMI